MELFMPTRLQRKQVYKGINQSDIRKIAVIMLSTIVTSFILFSIILQDSKSVVTMVCIVNFAVGLIVMLIFVRYDDNMNVIDNVSLMAQYLRCRKYYPFAKGREW